MCYPLHTFCTLLIFKSKVCLVDSLGYLQFITNAMNIFFTSATMALGKQEPYIAIINIRCANALLPPNDPNNPKDKSGYRLNLDKYLPKSTNKELHNVNYMDEARHKDQEAFQCVATIFPLVAEAVSRYAHEKKSEWGDG